MTAAQPPLPDEPPPPARGLTREELGRDVSPAQADLEAQTSTGKRILKAMDPRFLLSMAEGYPAGLKQFIQFCLILIYPAWLFFVLAAAAVYYPVYGLFWLLFAPVKLTSGTSTVQVRPWLPGWFRFRIEGVRQQR